MRSRSCATVSAETMAAQVAGDGLLGGEQRVALRLDIVAHAIHGRVGRDYLARQVGIALGERLQ